MNPNILIVDDHAVVRGGIRHILTTKYPKAEFSECSSGDQAIEEAKKRPYDLAFLDVSMPGHDGIETLQELKKVSPKLAVIMLSVFKEEAYSARAFQAGAAAYLQKGSDQGNILQATEVALSGKRFISSQVAENILDKSAKVGLNSLSQKEYSIFLRIAKGVTLKEIAAQMDISPKTVTTYRSRVLEKLGLDSNAAITKYALSQGLIE